MKLISMTDFVLEQTELYKEDKLSVFDFALRVKKYAQFLKEPLKLEMFVPCDDNGSVLEHPIYTTNHSDECYCKGCEEETKRCSDLQDQYKKAKEKVLFEGFECIKECDDYLCLTHENITIYYNIEEQIFMLDDNDDTVLAYIECFCNDFNYTYRYTNLTQNATKQFM